MDFNECRGAALLRPYPFMAAGTFTGGVEPRPYGVLME